MLNARTAASDTGWARSRLGSLAPLIIIHNASNLVVPLTTLWLST